MASNGFLKQCANLFKKLLALPLLVLVKIYQIFVSPFTTPSCRYSPSCSEYAMQALKKHGIFRGSYLAAKRILSCHPWGRSGYDPVP